MLQDKTHPMIMVASHPSGMVEWLCPACGCHVLVSWPPDCKRIILDPGDRSAAHISCKDDRSIDAAELRFADGEDATLAPWLEWMDSTNFERLWDHS
jgi:hypothetical protein